MAIYLANLVLNPFNLKKGANTVNFTYDGYVSGAAENQVTLTFSIADSGGEAVIAGGGLSVAFPSKDFPLALQNMAGSVTINVITDHGGANILNASLTGVTATGSSASAPASFTY